MSEPARVTSAWWRLTCQPMVLGGRWPDPRRERRGALPKWAYYYVVMIGDEVVYAVHGGLGCPVAAAKVRDIAEALNTPGQACERMRRRIGLEP